MTDLFSPKRTISLSDLEDGDQGDCFVLLVRKEKGQTRENKPYFRVNFRDQRRSVVAMIWHDTEFYADCDRYWIAGSFYKIRCLYRETSFGPQVELEKIRPVHEEDLQQGFSPDDYYARSRFDSDLMWEELWGIAQKEIEEEPVRRVVLSLLEDHKQILLIMSAASKVHHQYRGGFLEHVLSVTKSALYLADKYREYYPHVPVKGNHEQPPVKGNHEQPQSPISKSLIVAGAILHDIGKIIELDHRPQGAEFTPIGRLVGHILIGRDLLRDKIRELGLAPSESLLRLEHIIVAHQGTQEWGSPVAPMTPEALIVHYADDLDAKMNMMIQVLEQDHPPDAEFSERSNVLRTRVFLGLKPTSDS